MNPIHFAPNKRESHTNAMWSFVHQNSGKWYGGTFKGALFFQNSSTDIRGTMVVKLVSKALKAIALYLWY
jgi:hypothetical protein